MPIPLKSPAGWSGTDRGSWNPGLDMQGDAESRTEKLVTRTYMCRGGCGNVRVFAAMTEAMVGLQIASAGWKVDGPRGECPSCWLKYEASVLRAARGNS